VRRGNKPFLKYTVNLLGGKKFIYMERYIITRRLRTVCMEDDIAEAMSIFMDTSLKSLPEVRVYSV